jgi:hypothetical protein
MRLNGQLESVGDLTSAHRDRLFALMDRHYVNVSRENFETDLAEKQWVIIVRDPGGTICGFSTQTLLEAPSPGSADGVIHALFSGDTIIEKQHWGDPALSHVWGGLALKLIDRFGEGGVYWFLISKGYKTYRFLPLFFNDFYPRHDRDTPTWAVKTIGLLARHKFPDRYDDATGLVLPAPQSDRLRAGVADLTPPRLNDPHVRFFAECNPCHADGTELCCIAPLSRANFTSAAYRVIGARPAVVRR